MPVGPALILAEGSELLGATYHFTDPSAPRDPLRYWLEDVSTIGASTRHGPVAVPAYHAQPIKLPPRIDPYGAGSADNAADATDNAFTPNGGNEGAH